MHILLTDVLACPRCGPEFGLIVQADRLRDRQIIEGRLGCANCRQTYPIARGVADLRHNRPESGEEVGGDRVATGDSSGPGAEERGFRAAALMGAHAGPSAVLVVEDSGAVGASVAGALSETHVVAAALRTALLDSPASTPPDDPAAFLSRVLVGAVLPFRNHAFRAAALLDIGTQERIAEVARTLLPGARLVVDNAPLGTADRLRQAEYQVLLDQEGVVVAVTPGVR